MIDMTHKDVTESNAICIDGVEFVKVVRCKDCVHWYESNLLEDGFCNVWQRFVPFCGFCHKGDDGINCDYGKRRSE